MTTPSVPGMDEEFFEHIIQPFDKPGERVAFYLGLQLAILSPNLANGILVELRRRWAQSKDPQQIADLVENSIKALLFDYRSRLQ